VWHFLQSTALYVHNLSVAVVNDKLQSRTSTPSLQHYESTSPQLAPTPPIYVFESNCAYIVVCAEKLARNLKNPPVCYFNPPTFFTSPNFFRKEASCFHLSLEWMRLSTVGTWKDWWKRTKNYPTSNNYHCVQKQLKHVECSFLPCDALRCTVFVIVILSVCLSVCHTRGLCPHGSTYDHDFFTIW